MSDAELKKQNDAEDADHHYPQNYIPELMSDEEL